MNRRTALLSGAALPFLGAFASATATAAPSDDASAVIDRFAAAYSANDADAVLKLYTPDALLFGTSSPISRGTDGLRTYFSRIPGSGNKCVIGDRQLLVLDDNAVVGMGFYEFTLMQSGQPVPLPARFTMVIVKRSAAWLIAHHHSSRRPEPPK